MDGSSTCVMSAVSLLESREWRNIKVSLLESREWRHIKVSLLESREWRHIKAITNNNLGLKT